MSVATDTPHHAGPAHTAFEVLTALSMTMGRGPAARAVTDAAELTPQDRVVDIGCGPGTAVRQAARRAASGTGVDPSPATLRFARWISGIRRARNISWLPGRAEALPLPDASATVAWALSSVHHWADREAGIREIRRVLVPGGRMLLAERLVEPGARGLAAHGLTRDDARSLCEYLPTVGFTDVRDEIRHAGRRTLVMIHARRRADEADEESKTA